MAQASHITPISRVQHRSGRAFVIFDAPNDANIQMYIQQLQAEGVKHVVRVCEPTYSTRAMEEAGISVYDWPYPDGDPPPDQIINDWLSLIRSNFTDEKAKGKSSSKSAASFIEKGNIGIHCIAGLGRAPVLVAIGLIEDGMEPLDAVHQIRTCRRGAINTKQLSFLQSYKPRTKKDCTVQ